jgi:pectate lyase
MRKTEAGFGLFYAPQEQARLHVLQAPKNKQGCMFYKHQRTSKAACSTSTKERKLPMTTDSQKFTDSVTQFVETVNERCRDKYSGKKTPFLVDGINLKTDEPMRWETHILSNVACQQNFLRTLDGLSTVTGEPQYRTQARKWIEHAFDTLQDTASGMLYWGGHTSYALSEATPLVGNHELKCVYPYYRFLYNVSPQGTQAFIEGFWNRHIKDWSTLLFNRHGEYTDWNRATPWNHTYHGGQLPIIDNTMLSFINTGSDLIYAGGILAKLSGNREPLLWAKRLMHRYDEIRHPTTGLGGYQFNHRDPCRVRISFKPPFSEREDVNETTVITNGVIQTRYGRAALTWMNLFEELGGADGQDFLDMVSQDLTAIGEHSYNTDDHCFHAVLADGTILQPSNCAEGVGYCSPRKLEKVPANGLMFLAYAKAYRLTQNPFFEQMLRRLGHGMGWGELFDDTLDPSTVTRVSPSQQDSRANHNQNDICALFGLLELYKATNQKGFLRLATHAANGLIDSYVIDGFFTTGGESKTGFTNINSALPLALLHLTAAIENLDIDLPTFYPNSTDFDPKVIIARRKSGR